ncbi:hypothetical protein PIROE2DRAFT_16229 [Piromyces sp. E2]|nr:hypothetical protein PIROE2DRAFT_16229 [Piromyces sp. E2]|eukprot:OUM58486.1 hypothetical protein PIROE2DRAFT_16229 [Piromyces sp. E2]
MGFKTLLKLSNFLNFANIAYFYKGGMTFMSDNILMLSHQLQYGYCGGSAIDYCNKNCQSELQNNTMTVEYTQQNEVTPSEPPPYTPGYTEPPFDDPTVEYNKLISIPDHEITIIDKYVSTQHMKFYLKDRDEICERDSHGNLNIHENDTIDIFDNENVDQFYCKKTKEKITIFDIENTPIANVTTKLDANCLIYINKGEGNSEIYATIKVNDSLSNCPKCKVFFMNKANNETEELEMRFEKHGKYYCIYSKEVLIGTIKKFDTGRIRKRYVVEIAPMVDFMFLLSLATLVVKIEKCKEKKNETKKSAALIALSTCIIS